MIQEKTLKISGMHCTSCVINIDGELEEALGVLKAEASFPKQEVSVQYDTEKISLLQIKQIIEKLGYTVTD